MNFLNELYQNVVLTSSPRSFFILAAAAVFLYRIPIIDKILRTFHTLLHESGHAFTALLTGGKNHRMELKPNMSGMTITESKNKVQQFFIAIAGYPFASAFAFFGFYLILNNITGIFHIVLLVIVAIQLLFNIRNTYGIIWSLAVISLLLLEMIKMPQLMWATGVVICSIILFESLIMAGHILMLSFIDHKKAGDAFNIQRLTGIHAGFWGLIFFGQAVIFTLLTVKLVIGWL
jgi:hypothetical protein